MNMDCISTNFDMDNDFILFRTLVDLGVSPYVSALSDSTKQAILDDLRGYLMVKPFENDSFNEQLTAFNRRRLDSDRQDYEQMCLEFPSDEML